MRLKPIRGSGIGLALVQHIARAHGGDVTVDEHAGRRRHVPASGCRSLVRTRRDRCRDESPAKKRILVIEDEPDIVRGLRDALEFEGFEVEARGTGAEGLAAAMDWAPDACCST